MKLLLAAVILAHSWYPSECCNGDAQTGDCRPVPCEELHVDRQWLKHGDHWIFSNEVRQSPDGQCHVCELPTSERMYCAWVPEGMS